MTDPLIDRAITFLGDSPRVALPVAELARRLGTVDPDGLARRLAGDPRLLLIEPPALPGLALLPADRQAAYERALRAAGLRSAPRVALLHRTPHPGAGVAALLRHTAAQLLTPGPDAEAVADAAERANRALLAALRGGAGAPSTTHPPDPPP